MITDISAWPPSDGQCLDEAGAAALMDGHHHRIRQAVFDAYTRIDTSRPGVTAGHRLARPAELTRCCREAGRDGCVVATVLRDCPDDGRWTIQLLLTWTGEIRTGEPEADERQLV